MKTILRAVALVVILMMAAPVAVIAQDTAVPDSVAAADTMAVPASPDTVKPAGEGQVTEADSASSEIETAVSETQSDLRDLTRLISFRKILQVLLLFLLTYLLNKGVARILDNLSERFSGYRLGIKRLVPIFRITIWSVGLYIMIEGVIDPPFETVITVMASVGIAVGFASQDILKNIFGGFMIIMDRPFQVGDKIEVASYYGEVTQIGLRSTRIVTPDDSVVTIPNSELMNRAVSNANSSALDCQVVAEIYLTDSVDLAEIKEIAREAAISSKYTYLKKPVSVVTLNEVTHRGPMVKLRVKAYVLDIRYEFQLITELTDTILGEVNRRKLSVH